MITACSFSDDKGNVRTVIRWSHVSYMTVTSHQKNAVDIHFLGGQSTREVFANEGENLKLVAAFDEYTKQIKDANA